MPSNGIGKPLAPPFINNPVSGIERVFMTKAKNTVLCRGNGSRNVAIYPPNIRCSAHPGSPVFPDHWAIVWWLPSMPQGNTIIKVADSQQHAIEMVEQQIGPGNWMETQVSEFEASALTQSTKTDVEVAQSLLKDGDYELAGKAVWLGTDIFRVRVREVAEGGILVDVYSRGIEGEPPLDSLAVGFPDSDSSDLEWLVLPDEQQKTYTNFEDGRPVDASELVAKVNADPTLNQGNNDWRLPTIDELKALIGTRRDPKTGWYWSSSPYVGGSDGAWGVVFGDGSVSDLDRDGGLHVRLVRASQ